MAFNGKERTKNKISNLSIGVNAPSSVLGLFHYVPHTKSQGPLAQELNLFLLCIPPASVLGINLMHE